VLVEKPMALTLEECHAMIEAARKSGVHLVVGHSHSFDAPIARARALIDSGAFGCVRMLCALNYTDFLYRPRRPEELVTAQGGGVIYSQAAHQVDIVRRLIDSPASSVRAATGNWDPARPAEGAYSALLQFANGAFASLSYSGYGRFDSDALVGGIGELGEPKPEDHYGSARRRLASFANPGEESAYKAARNYGGSEYRAESNGRPTPRVHQHFGFVLVSLEQADLRPLPTGVAIYGAAGARFEPLPPPAVPRAEVIDELVAAIRHGRPSWHDGPSALATLEICRAMLRSAQEGREIPLEHQVTPGRAAIVSP
jgi:phthalate 4,5-cis-dihydrodiol dehydrogenase